MAGVVSLEVFSQPPPNRWPSKALWSRRIRPLTWSTPLALSSSASSQMRSEVRNGSPPPLKTRSPATVPPRRSPHTSVLSS